VPLAPAEAGRIDLAVDRLNAFPTEANAVDPSPAAEADDARFHPDSIARQVDILPAAVCR
jgi:hypothetical protein